MNFENFQNPEKLQIVNFTIPFEFFELEFFLWFLISEIENFRQKFIKKFIVRFLIGCRMNQVWLAQLGDIRI